MKFHLLASACLFMALALPIGAEAASQGTLDHMKMDHRKMMAQSTSKLPTEGGQSAFAAIAEIVALLETDPKTDWSKVNIEALRQHLIDMNNVTLEAVVDAKNTETGMSFDVSGVGSVVGSIQRMVSAHVKSMDGVGGWKFSSVETAKGATMVVVPPNAASVTKLRALGFIGVMVRGMHHQEHHWMIANGMNPHS